jgi:Flp pilus assembly protein TadG
MTSRHGQRGQTLPIFALVSLVIIGLVALAIDFGFLANSHRNLQAFTDESATAGANTLGLTPGPTDRAAARTAAFIYLRDNLLGTSSSVTTASIPSSCYDAAGNIGGSGSATCQLPGTSYTISIWSPSETAYNGTDPQFQPTISVRVSETVTTALAGLLGQSTSGVGAFAVAQYTNQQSPYALYSDGCVTVRSVKTEIVQGDAYVNTCTISPGAGAFCTRSAPYEASPRFYGAVAAPGNTTYGRYSTLPATILGLQAPAGCTAAAAGTTAATGNILKTGTFAPPPTYDPPPSIPATAGAANSACTNGSKTSSGPPSNCYAPGVYSTMTGVANNLNPGVYVVTGDPSSNCYKDSTSNTCAGIVFTGNTLNANYNDVQDRCWANPNVPSSDTFSGNCPDGFITDPTVPVDPQCTPSCGTLLTPPTFVLTPVPLDPPNGQLDPSTTGTRYYVRVSATDSFGETTTTESSTIVASPPGKGAITVAITVQAGATGYRVYGPSTAANTETLNPVTPTCGPVTCTAFLESVPTSVQAYPTVNTTQCTSFCNLPVDATQNYGVTIVLQGKAGVCFGSVNNGYCSSPPGLAHPVVMLSPSCSGGFTLSGSTPICNVSPPGVNDGTFVFYGSTTGTIYPASTGVGAVLAMTGVIYTPRATLQVDGARLQVVPGQVVIHDALLKSTNVLDPIVYYGPSGPNIYGQVRLLR